MESLKTPFEDSLRGNQLFDDLLKECDEYIHCKPDFGIDSRQHTPNNQNMDPKLIEQIAELVS